MGDWLLQYTIKVIIRQPEPNLSSHKHYSGTLFLGLKTTKKWSDWLKIAKTLKFELDRRKPTLNLMKRSLRHIGTIDLEPIQSLKLPINMKSISPLITMKQDTTNWTSGRAHIHFRQQLTWHCRSQKASWQSKWACYARNSGGIQPKYYNILNNNSNIIWQ